MLKQELLLDTKHAQEQKGAITLTMFGRPPQDIDQTTLQQPQKGRRFALMPPWASGHIGGSRQGHPRYTDARKGRPWVAHNTIHSAANVHNQQIKRDGRRGQQCSHCVAHVRLKVPGPFPYMCIFYALAPTFGLLRRYIIIHRKFH